MNVTIGGNPHDRVPEDVALKALCVLLLICVGDSEPMSEVTVRRGVGVHVNRIVLLSDNMRALGDGDAVAELLCV